MAEVRVQWVRLRIFIYPLWDPAPKALHARLLAAVCLEIGF
jgi:hypothetical protein